MNLASNAMKRITISQRNNLHFCLIDGIPAGPMYDCFDRGQMKHPWPYRDGNNGHNKHQEAVDFAEKLCDFFNEVAKDKDKLVPKAAGKQASPLYWGGATFETGETI